MTHQGIIQIIIAYTLVGAFVFTVVATSLSLVGWIEFKDSKQQKRLFSILIVELVAGCVGFFFNFLTLNPAPVVKEITVQAFADVQKRVDNLLGQIDSLPDMAVLSLETQPPIHSAEIERVVTLRDPENRRAISAVVARQMLRMRVVLGQRNNCTN